MAPAPIAHAMLHGDEIASEFTQTLGLDGLVPDGMLATVRPIPYLDGLAWGEMADWQPTGDFEVEVVAAPILDGSDTSYHCLLGLNAGANPEDRPVSLWVRGDGAIYGGFGDGTTWLNGVSAASIAISAKTQTVGIRRSGTSVYLTHNGADVKTIAVGASAPVAGATAVGRQATGAYFDGHILSLSLTDTAGGDDRVYDLRDGSTSSSPDRSGSNPITWTNLPTPERFTRLPGGAWLGSESIGDTEMDDLAWWAKVNCTMSGGKANFPGNGSYAALHRAGNLISGARYRVSGYLDSIATGGGLRLSMPGYPQIADAAGAFSVVFAAGNTNTYLYGNPYDKSASLDRLSCRPILEPA